MNTQNSNVIQLSPGKGKGQGISLNNAVKECLSQYFEELNGTPPGNLYDMVLQQVEGPLLEMVLAHVDGNQSRASEYLGINRGTLRKKLKSYELIK